MDKSDPFVKCWERETDASAQAMMRSAQPIFVSPTEYELMRIGLDGTLSYSEKCLQRELVRFRNLLLAEDQRRVDV